MMERKIQITVKQAEQFNRMLQALRKIYKDYQTPEQLRRNCEKDYGLDYEESIGMAYENIQAEAAFASRGLKPIALSKPQTANH